MTTQRPARVLFLCHAASRNGASLLLLHLLQWLRPRVDWRIDVLVDGPGPLVDDFRAVARTRVLRDPHSLTTLLPRAARERARRFLQARYLDLLCAGQRFDLVYANTSATWRCVEALARRAAPIVWHVHEMEYALRRSMPRDAIAGRLGRAARIVAVSEATRDALVRAGLDDARIVVVPGFVAPVEAAARSARRARVRATLGWSDDAFVVGGCGALGWRKGSDLFVQVAHAVTGSHAHAGSRFLWVGGEPDDRETLEFEHDRDALGLGNRCRLVATTPEVADYFCAFDAFALTSREDPFPLVMLEAAAHGLPVVCFAGSGGGPEFVGADAGRVSPPLAVADFAAQLMRLHDDPALRATLGDAGRQRVEREHGRDRQGARLMQVIERCLREAGASAGYRDAVGGVAEPVPSDRGGSR